MDSVLEMGRSRENVVTPQDLYDCFAGIEGKNVLIMDCCYSGTMGSQTRSVGLHSSSQKHSQPG